MKPEIKMKAIDVVPYLHGILCTFDGRPEVIENGIVAARWSEDTPGQIIFMLDTHNFLFHMADEEIEVIELKSAWTTQTRERHLAEHAAFVAKRPSAEAIRRRTAVKAAGEALKGDDWDSVRKAMRILQDALVAEVPVPKSI